MIIQDIIFTVGSFILFLALLPTVFDKFSKPKSSSSLVTAIVLTAFVFNYATLGLWLSVVSGSLVSGAWWILYIQKKHKDKTFRRSKADV